MTVMVLFLKDFKFGSGVNQMNSCPDSAEKPENLPRVLYSSQGLDDSGALFCAHLIVRF